MHAGIGNVFIGIRWGKVLQVRRGEARGEGQGIATQWVADIEDQHAGGGHYVEGATIIGPRIPRVHTDLRPSFVVWGTMGGDIRTPWCLPCPWTSCAQADIESHDMLDEHETLTIHLYRNPKTGATFYTIKKPEAHTDEGGGHVVQERYLQIVADKDGHGLSFEMLGGARLMARAGTRDAPTAGDYVVINGATSPQFVIWQNAITAAVNGLAAVAAQLAAGQTALAAQTAELTTFALAAATAIPIAPPTVPAPPVAPAAPPAAVAIPSDGVPAVDGLAAVPPAPNTTVGQIVSGSPFTRGL